MPAPASRDRLVRTVTDEVLNLALQAETLLSRAAYLQEVLGHPGGTAIHDALRNGAASAARATEEILHP